MPIQPILITTETIQTLDVLVAMICSGLIAAAAFELLCNESNNKNHG